MILGPTLSHWLGKTSTREAKGLIIAKVCSTIFMAPGDENPAEMPCKGTGSLLACFKTSPRLLPASKSGVFEVILVLVVESQAVCSDFPQSNNSPPVVSGCASMG